MGSQVRAITHIVNPMRIIVRPDEVALERRSSDLIVFKLTLGIVKIVLLHQVERLQIAALHVGDLLCNPDKLGFFLIANSYCGGLRCGHLG